MKHKVLYCLLMFLLLNSCNTRYRYLRKVRAEQIAKQGVEPVIKFDIHQSEELLTLAQESPKDAGLRYQPEISFNQKNILLKVRQYPKSKCGERSVSFVVDENPQEGVIENKELPSGNYKWAIAMAMLALLTVPLILIAPGFLLIPLSFALIAWLISRFGKSDSNPQHKKWLYIVELGAAILMVVLFLLMMGAIMAYMLRSVL